MTGERIVHKRSKKTPPGVHWKNKYKIFKFPFDMLQALEIARRLEKTGWVVTITTVTAPDFFHESMLILEGRKE